MTGPSVTAPIDQALKRTGRILFKPFQIEKWFVLGFCAWLASLGEGGGSGCNFPNYSGQSGSGGGPSQDDVQEALDWISTNLGLIIIIAVLALLVILAISGVIMWLRSRGTFMFFDGIVRNRGAVVEPWKEFKREGDSYFLLQFTLMIIQMLLTIGLVALALAIAWPDIQQQEFGSAGITAIIVGGALLLIFGIGFGLFMFMLRHFVAPTMYIHRIGAVEAIGIAWRELIAPNIGSVILYLLMRIVLGIAIGVLALVATCATCCIAALPYIGTVILLPLFVFDRSYTLYFIESFGPEWQVFTIDVAPPLPEV